jgi:hypothetical protein
MNLAKLFFFSIALIISIPSCKQEENNSFAIRDFSKLLQPYLIEVVSKGIVGFDSSTRFIQTKATDKELEQLSKSEHPVLRAVAFRAMLERKSFNHFDLIMSHLDDTAIVATDRGEFGIDYRTVSDDILEHGTWKDSASREITIDSVILYHNYLKSAYKMSLQVNLAEKYYTSIKEMALRNNELLNGKGISFFQVEQVLIALAAFKKKEDIEIIKKILLANTLDMSPYSFQLMEEFPNAAYMEVFKKYYPRSFYRAININPGLCSNAGDFFRSLASYKSDSSAKMLSSILNEKPFMPYVSQGQSLKWELEHAIWDNPCAAYSKLRKQIEVPMEEDEKLQKKAGYIEPYVMPKDTSAGPVRWW